MDALARMLADALEGGGMGSWFLAPALAYLGGVLSSLTPCVYPMIPITVGVIGGGPAVRGGEAHRVAFAATRGGVYVMGMVLVYALLGVLAGATGRIFGSFTNTTGWYLGLGLVVTVAALVMLDAIPFDPVGWWAQLRHRLGFPTASGHGHHRHGHHQPKGNWDAFALGASSGLVAAPCTTPVLTAILAYIAQSGSIATGFILMLFFSLGLGTLLLVIATFAGALRFLPRSGNWMKAVKVASGLLLLGFGEYLVYRAGRAGVGLVGD